MAELVHGQQGVSSVPVSPISNALYTPDWDERIWQRYNTKFPLFLQLKKQLPKLSMVGNMLVWNYDEQEARYTEINFAAGYAAADTALVVKDASIFRPNTLVEFENSTGAKEVAKVISVVLTTNTINVSRGWGSTAAITLAHNDKVRKAGTSFPIGSGLPISAGRYPSSAYNRSQIFKETVDVANTVAKVKTKAGDMWAYHKKAAEERISLDIEHELFFGQLKEVSQSSTADEETNMKGLYYFCDDAIKSPGYKNWGGAVLDEASVDNQFINSGVHEFGSPDKLVFCDKLAFIAFTKMFKNRELILEKDKTFGTEITQYVSPYGMNFSFVIHPLFSREGRRGIMFFVDMKPDYIGLVAVNGGDGIRELHYIDNTQLPGVDKKQGYWLAEYSLRVQNPKAHFVWEGIGG